MVLRLWRATSLLLVATLLLTSCIPGVFEGQAGVDQAALEAMPKPPLEIAQDGSQPLPELNAEDFEPPRPPLRPFSVSASLFPHTAAAEPEDHRRHDQQTTTSSVSCRYLRAK